MRRSPRVPAPVVAVVIRRAIEVRIVVVPIAIDGVGSRVLVDLRWLLGTLLDLAASTACAECSIRQFVRVVFADGLFALLAFGGRKLEALVLEQEPGGFVAGAVLPVGHGAGSVV